MQHIGAADNTYVAGFATQGGLLGAEIGIVRIYGPNDSPLEVHYDFQVRPTGRTHGPGHRVYLQGKRTGIFG
jgi:hypothetical protein